MLVRGRGPLCGRRTLMPAEGADHGHAFFRGRLRLGNLKRCLNEPGDVLLRPTKPPVPVGPRLGNAAELREQGVAPRSQQPVERGGFFGVRLPKQLDRRDGEHPVHEILGTTPRSDPASV